MKIRSAIATLLFAVGPWLQHGVCQDPGASRTYLVKLSVPVSASESKSGDRIRAAIISPESLLNGYLEGIVEEARAKPSPKLVLRFKSVLFRNASTPIETEVIDFVNSKGHKSVDDSERPLRLANGVFSSTASDAWLDEGAELRVRAEAAGK
jgi:hypothetical protein